MEAVGKVLKREREKDSTREVRREWQLLYAAILKSNTCEFAKGTNALLPMPSLTSGIKPKQLDMLHLQRQRGNLLPLPNILAILTATTTATATARRRVTAFETASAIEKCRASVRVALQQSLSLVCTSKYGAAAKALGTAMERENSAAKYRKITRGESLPRGHVGSSLGAMAAAEAALEAAKYL